VTRPGEAGLDLLPDGSCRVHTWALGIAGYMATTREWADTVVGRSELYDAYWRNNDVSLVHFLGHDCAYSHLVIYPSLLSNLAGPKPTPQFYPNQFLKLDGKSLSTSRNHAIWVHDLIRDYDSDAVRLYLASVAPEETESNFQLDMFRRWYRATFVKVVDALIEKARAERNGAVVPEPPADDQLLLAGFNNRWSAATCRRSFSMLALARIIFDLIALGHDRMQFGQPIAHIVEAVGELGQALHPKLSQRIRATIGTQSHAESVSPKSDYLMFDYSI